MSKVKRYQVSLRTTPELISEVDARAQAYGVSRNQFIVQSIQAAIAASYARQALQPPTDGTVPEAPAKNIVVTEDEDTHMGVRAEKPREELPYVAGPGGVLPQEAGRSEPIEGLTPSERIVVDALTPPDESVDIDWGVTAGSSGLEADTRWDPEEEITLADPELGVQRDERHVHRYNEEVPDSEHYVKGTRWVQHQCACGAVIAKKTPRKAM